MDIAAPQDLVLAPNQVHALARRATSYFHDRFERNMFFRIFCRYLIFLIILRDISSKKKKKKFLLQTRAKKSKKKKLEMEESEGCRRIGPAYCTWGHRKEWRPCEWDQCWDHRWLHRRRRRPASTSRSCQARSVPERRSSWSETRRRCWSLLLVAQQHRAWFCQDQRICVRWRQRMKRSRGSLGSETDAKICQREPSEKEYERDSGINCRLC